MSGANAPKKIRFLSSNPHKISEVREILGPKNIEAIPVPRKIEEIQTDDVIVLVRDKAIRAYEMIGRPLFVEHTGLYADALKGLPGGLTQVFWDKLEADAIAAMFRALGTARVTAKTHIAYIDGRSIRVFVGEVVGSFAEEPRGNRDFQWDCVFIPDGYSQTFAEMGATQKNKISMRRIALDNFAEGVKDDS